MRNACRTALTAAVIFISCGTASAQRFPNGLATDSAAPEADALVIRQVREHLDRVRARENRPTVGLVLSGGGAKGAAEVGALKYIEEKGIPVDFICGTSIGGLLGSAYALGYTADDLEDLFRSQDWDRMLTDKVDDSYIPYSTKAYRSRFAINIPFHYSNSDTKVDLGASGSGLGSLYSSLPSGYAYGLNLHNLLSSLTVGYQDSLSFSKLPIPVICVSADMVSCKSKNWGSGSITTAMRSTMSIPGLFAPVRTKSMVLVDGGVRNNYPVDIARAVGADYIIGIDISDERPDYSNVNNFANVVDQLLTMLGNDSYNRNMDVADAYIKPDISGYGMMSFSAEAVDTLIKRGYQAAALQEKDLKAIVSRTKGARQKYQGPKAVDISRHSVRLASVEFEGVSGADQKYLYKKIGIKPGDSVTKDIMDDAIFKLSATGAFESVIYSLYGSGEPYRLVFHCNTGATHRLGLGFRADSEEWASVLVNIGLNTKKFTGPKLDLTAKIGQNLSADVIASLASYALPTINLEFMAGRNRGRLGTNMNALSYDVGFWTHKEQLYLSDIRLTSLNFKAGIRNQYFSMLEGSYLADLIGSIDKKALSGGYLGLFAGGELNTFNNQYYPTRGIDFKVKADYDFVKYGVSGFKPILGAGLDFKAAIPAGQYLTILPEIHARSIANAGDLSEAGSDHSIIHSNFVGGAIAGRYIDNQVPFFGINNVIMAEPNLATVSLELRGTPAKNLHVSAMAGYIKSEKEIVDIIASFTPYLWAAGVGVGYNTIVGPLKFNIHWNNNSRWGMYASLGFDF